MTGGPIEELARAKVNLTLEILGKRADGYHELTSLVAFAAFGDWLRLRAADAWSLACTGPTAGDITGANLVDRAAALVARRWPGSATGRAELYKALPVAAGIGGGSADAAACLRALRRLNGSREGAPDWSALAQELGADVPVCLAGGLAIMGGLGEQVRALDLGVELPAVLVNPGTLLSTADVFANLAAPMLGSDFEPPRPPRLADAAAVLAAVANGRNDLEAPALRLAPAVGRVRAALQAQPGCHIARMSGSGPTCFGLFATPATAALAAQAIARAEPDWWVQATTLA